MLYDLAGPVGQIVQALTFAAGGQSLAVHGHQGTIQTSPVVLLTSLGYSGEFFDTAARQQYLRARFYNPANGQFNRLDPFAGNMQDPQSLHKYAYVHADPVNLNDPTGLFGIGGTLASIGIGLGNVATELVAGSLIIGTLEYAARPAFDGRTAGLLLIANGETEFGFYLYKLSNRVIKRLFDTLDHIDMAVGFGTLGVALGIAAFKLAKKAPGLATSISSYADNIFASMRRGDPAGSYSTATRKGGIRISPEALNNAAPHGVLDLHIDTFTIVRRDDEVLDARAAVEGTEVNGLFEVLSNGEMRITIRSDATYYEYLHELMHYEHAVELGPKNWAALRNQPGGKLKMERIAFDKLKRSEHWQHFTDAERKAAEDDIAFLEQQAGL